MKRQILKNSARCWQKEKRIPYLGIKQRMKYKNEESL